MSNSDFQDRLARIGAKAPAPPPITRMQRLGYGRLAIGALAMSSGLYMLRTANDSYNAIRDQYSIPAALGLALGGLVLLLIGIVHLFRSIRQADAQPSGHAAPAPVRTSAGARAFFSVLGLCLGALACLVMFIGNAASQPAFSTQIDAVSARALFVGMAILAALLGTLAFLIGLVGLFVRGLPMRRVPIFFLLGAMLVYSGFQTFRIHPANWPTFMTEVISSFKDQAGRRGSIESTQ
jgi:hypothetical protein